MSAVDTYKRAGEFHGQGLLDEAIVEYRKALAFDSQFFPAWYSQGCAWEAKGELANALACFHQAVLLAPDHHESRHNLGNALFGLGLVDEAIQSWRAALALGAGFLSRTALAVGIPGSPKADNLAILEARRDWAEFHLPAPPATRRRPEPGGAGRRMRVGYLGSFFAHPNWMKPVWGLVNEHDRERVELHLFSDAPEASCQPGYRRQADDRFHDISELGNQVAAKRIAECDLDLLVDLNGYSRVERLAVMALKPAPVQVGWFNFYATSGMACYDYLVGDDQVIPRAEEGCYLEKILRVPGSYLTFNVSHPAPEVAASPALTTGFLTFGCLASAYKITPPVIEAWSRILRGTPSAKLFLKNSALRSRENRRFLAQRFAQFGIQPDRVAMEGPAEHFEFLAAYGRMDIALDTFPYNGGTTTMEALWQGVPVLAFHGDRWAARQSASILRAAGLPEFVAGNVEDYVERAVALAQTPGAAGKLSGLRQGMRQHLTGAPVCDTCGFARALEALYAQISTRT
jgi:protein O-GlcNAc transferase